MLDKSEYYHGAAIVRLLEDEKCRGVRKREFLGYVVNDDIFALLKYTTKGRSPWGFTFDQEDIDRCTRMASEYRRAVVGLICGGDGVCAVSWAEATQLLDGKPGRIAAGRKHNCSYSVWGSAAELKKKVPVGRWPALVFEQSAETRDNVVALT